MNAQVEPLITNHIRKHGVSLILGDIDSYIKRLVKDEVITKQGRLDIISPFVEEPKFVKNVGLNTYDGPGLYWSSSIPNLEYDVVYLNSASAQEGETLVQLLHEYWPIVREGGVLLGDYNLVIKDALDKAFDLDNSKFEKLNIDNNEEYWWRTK